MIINWYGHSCFRITNQGGHLIIITDPFDKKIGLNPPRCGADIVTISHQHDDHNNIKTITGMEESKPFIIDSPGEYEIKGVSLIGCHSFHDEEKKEQNIIYIMEVDKIRICHLGDFGQDKLEDKQISGKQAFDLYQTYGFPLEITKELADEKKCLIDETACLAEMKKHQELSRTASAGVFKGGLADSSQQTKKLHTAAHFLFTEPLRGWRKANVRERRTALDWAK